MEVVEGTDNWINSRYMRGIEKWVQKLVDIQEKTAFFEWLYGMPRGKVRLAYFLEKVYRDLPTAQIPYKELNRLFGVNRLDSAYNQIKSDGDSQKVKLWKEQIDKLFND